MSKRKMKQHGIIRSETDLRQLSELLIKSFSFCFRTIDEAKRTVNMGPYTYVFDATTLLPYHCNLTYAEGKLLDAFMKPFFRRIRDEEREKYKELRERRTLLHFLLSAPRAYRNSTIFKRERPDFVLFGEKHIGIEITKLTTQYDETIFTLNNQLIEKGLTQEEEIKAHINRYHSKIANKIKLIDIKGNVHIATSLLDIDSNRKQYAEEIRNKYKKYRDQIDQFDEFVILGDAASGSGLEISDKNEVQETIDYLLSICPGITDCTTVIAWRKAEHQERIIYSWYRSTNRNRV